jgi:hypothetical protein
MLSTTALTKLGTSLVTMVTAFRKSRHYRSYHLSSRIYYAAITDHRKSRSTRLWSQKKGRGGGGASQTCPPLDFFLNLKFKGRGKYVKYCVRFEVLTAMVMKSTIFWDTTPCSRALLPTAFRLVFCSAYSSALKMEAICSSETSVDFQRTTRRYIFMSNIDTKNLNYFKCDDIYVSTGRPTNLGRRVQIFLNDLNTSLQANFPAPLSPPSLAGGHAFSTKTFT